MLYYSTNKKAKEVNFKEALMNSLADDKGLYMPNFIPGFSVEELEEIKSKEYWEIAFLVLRKFLDDLPEEKLKEVCKEAYNFPVPIEKIDDLHIMRMDRGPTLSFKDFAMRFMAKIMAYYLDRKMIILTATSGDTGGACADAFYNLNKIKVVILMPHKEISLIQRRQMTTLGKNIFPITINGKFDDCQYLVKKAFSDSELKNLNLSSANSINIGRLLPQAVYYFYGYSQIAEREEKINFVVPSGNWGNQMGGLIAKRMNLPIEKFVAAVNENDETARFLETGGYEKIIPSRNCLSNAMNVGHPSNFARVVELYNGEMDENGMIIKQPDMEEMKKDLFIVSVNDKETKEAIKKAYEKGILIEPHGAVGWRAYEKVKSKLKGKIILLETGHPAKFPEVLNKLGIKVEVPEALRKFQDKKENYVNMNADYEKLKAYLRII